MLRNNVPQSIPPTCQTPQRVSGLMWNSLDIDDFACAPDIISTATEVTKYVGGNATLSCVVKGQPQPKIFWYVDDGFYRNLSSHLVRGEKFFLYEEKSDGIVNSMLTITGLEESDSQSFICSAENRAGIATKNFTITVMALPFGAVAGWSKVEVAGAVVGILSSLVFIFVLVTIFLIRSRRSHHPPDDKPSPISVLKNLSPGVKCESSGIKSHVTVIGKDGNEKKPENGNNSSGYGSGGMTPDLTKTGFDLNGYHNNISGNGYTTNESHFTSQMMPTIGYQTQSQLSVGNQSFTQLAPDVSQ
ncbi:unnamed protein product, partial [Medioppia subpectinata]